MGWTTIKNSSHLGFSLVFVQIRWWCLVPVTECNTSLASLLAHFWEIHVQFLWIKYRQIGNNVVLRILLVLFIISRGLIPPAQVIWQCAALLFLWDRRLLGLKSFTELVSGNKMLILWQLGTQGNRGRQEVLKEWLTSYKQSFEVYNANGGMNYIILSEWENCYKDYTVLFKVVMEIFSNTSLWKACISTQKSKTWVCSSLRYSGINTVQITRFIIVLHIHVK